MTCSEFILVAAAALIASLAAWFVSQWVLKRRALHKLRCGLIRMGEEVKEATEEHKIPDRPWIDMPHLLSLRENLQRHGIGEQLDAELDSFYSCLERTNKELMVSRQKGDRLSDEAVLFLHLDASIVPGTIAGEDPCLKRLLDMIDGELAGTRCWPASVWCPYKGR
jgi:hypothetical protein